MDTTTTTLPRVPAQLWTEGIEEFEGDRVHVEVERTAVDEVAIHTFDDDGRGSIVSTYLTTEQAREMAFRLLREARPR